MKITRVIQGIGVIVGVLALAASAQAALFTTANGTALVTAGAGTITITLTDTAVNPTSIIENISGFVFSTSSGSDVSGTVDPEPGVTYVNVNRNRTFEFVSGAARWKYEGTSAQYVLLWNAGGAGTGPDYTIIGVPGGSTYSNANGSIKGNDPHNPFIYHTATFVLDIAGVTANTVISNGIILFGTSPEIPNVPEASALMLFGSSLVGLVVYRRKRRLQ